MWSMLCTMGSGIACMEYWTHWRQRVDVWCWALDDIPWPFCHCLDKLPLIQILFDGKYIGILMFICSGIPYYCLWSDCYYSSDGNSCRYSLLLYDGKFIKWWKYLRCVYSLWAPLLMLPCCLLMPVQIWPGDVQRPSSTGELLGFSTHCDGDCFHLQWLRVTLEAFVAVTGGTIDATLIDPGGLTFCCCCILQ